MVLDTTAAVIFLNDDADITLTQGVAWSDPGAVATDETDGDLTGSIVVGGNVNTAVLGNYQLTYNVSDAAGNPAIEVVRTVSVVAPADTTAPVITLIGDTNEEITQGEAWIDPGATAFDDVDGDITGSIQVTGNIDSNTLGVQTLTYSVDDAAGNSATPVQRTVTVVADLGRSISIPLNSISIKRGEEPTTHIFSATASDNGIDVSEQVVWEFQSSQLHVGDQLSLDINFLQALSIGDHTLTASYDNLSDPVVSEIATITITANAAPTISIFQSDQALE